MTAKVKERDDCILKYQHRIHDLEDRILDHESTITNLEKDKIMMRIDFE